MIEIDKGVPIPARGAGARKYPISDLEIGDSFWVGVQHGAQLAGIANRRYAPKRFMSRTENGGTRIWRIA